MKKKVSMEHQNPPNSHPIQTKNPLKAILGMGFVFNLDILKFL
jgi:hypothetical protein